MRLTPSMLALPLLICISCKRGTEVIDTGCLSQQAVLSQAEREDITFFVGKLREHNEETQYLDSYIDSDTAAKLHLEQPGEYVSVFSLLYFGFLNLSHDGSPGSYMRHWRRLKSYGGNFRLALFVSTARRSDRLSFVKFYLSCRRGTSAEDVCCSALRLVDCNGIFADLFRSDHSALDKRVLLLDFKESIRIDVNSLLYIGYDEAFAPTRAADSGNLDSDPGSGGATALRSTRRYDCTRGWRKVVQRHDCAALMIPDYGSRSALWVPRW